MEGTSKQTETLKEVLHITRYTPFDAKEIAQRTKELTPGILLVLLWFNQHAFTDGTLHSTKSGQSELSNDISSSRVPRAGCINVLVP